MSVKKISEFPSITPAQDNRVLLENPNGPPTASDGIGQTTLRQAVLAAGLAITDLADVSIASTPSNGDVLTWSDGTWTAAPPSSSSSPGSSLQYYVDTLASDVAMAASNTWYTAITRTLESGVWLVIGQIGFWRTATTARIYYGRILAGGTTISLGQIYMPSVNPSGATLTLVGVTDGGVAVTLQGATSAGATADVIKASGTLDTARWTRMVYVKIA